MKMRIVTDLYNGYEVQYRVKWWPFWLQCGYAGRWGVNTHESLDLARDFAERWLKRRLKQTTKGRVVEQLW